MSFDGWFSPNVWTVPASLSKVGKTADRHTKHGPHHIASSTTFRSALPVVVVVVVVSVQCAPPPPPTKGGGGPGPPVTQIQRGGACGDETGPSSLGPTCAVPSKFVRSSIFRRMPRRAPATTTHPSSAHSRSSLPIVSRCFLSLRSLVARSLLLLRISSPGLPLPHIKCTLPPLRHNPHTPPIDYASCLQK